MNNINIMTPAEVVNKFNYIIGHFKKEWLAETRKERLKVAPFSTLSKAVIRRVWFLLAKLHFVPSVIRVKTFFGDRVYASVWSGLTLVGPGFHTGEDLKLTKFIVDTLKPGDVFVDGGASYGWYALVANALGAKAYAFEPTNKMYQILAKNAEGRNITAYHAALWSSAGQMEFNDFGDERYAGNALYADPERLRWAGKGKKSKYPVRTLTLDDIPRADFIKLDCEEVEYEILTGAKKALEHKPILAVEILDTSRKNGMGDKVVNFLAQKGYKGFYITNDFKLAPLEEKGEAPMINAIFLPKK